MIHSKVYMPTHVMIYSCYSLKGENLLPAPPMVLPK